jgi:uncharacterized protein (DUF2236 family)
VARRPPARGPLTELDPGLFGPDSVTWGLDREAFLLLGAGPRALLLQIAHPAIAAGVAEHSAFRADPWARLAGTLRSYLRIVYGTTAEARSEIDRLGRLHGRVHGTLPDGTLYDARDPELALWVHATLVDAMLATADAWLGPLGGRARARAYEESLPVGRAFRIPGDLLPADVVAFDGYVGRMLGPGGPVHPGPVARDLATSILHPPPGPAVRTLVDRLDGLAPRPLLDGVRELGDRVPPSAVGWLTWPAIGLLPVTVREAYGFRWGPFERAISGWLVASWRAWNALLPPSFRQMPQALAADRRVATARARTAPGVSRAGQ